MANSARVTIRIPENLAQYCDGQRTVSLAVVTASDAIVQLVVRFPSAGPRLLEEDGRLRGHLMMLCNDQAVAADEMAARELVEGDELALLFLAGGG